jgi:hypothetical protein
MCVRACVRRGSGCGRARARARGRRGKAKRQGRSSERSLLATGADRVQVGG